jgi:drug/metabolite transporter (DMT)-like permease
LILILIGLIPSGLAYFWWAAGLKRLSAINTSIYLFIEAIVASVTAFFVLKESFTALMLFFAVIIIVGVYITQSQGKNSRQRNS